MHIIDNYAIKLVLDKFFLLVAVFIVVSAGDAGPPKGLPAAAKDEVAKASSKTHGQEQPAVVRHGDQHEEVGHTNLDNVKG